MEIFIDGGKDATQLVKVISKNSSFARIFYTALNQTDDFIIRNELGINRGQKFYGWLKDLLKSYNIKTTNDIISKMNNFKVL